MITGLNMERAADPAYIFDAGREFVQTFGDSINGAAIDPFADPIAYARMARRLDPRNQQDGVFVAPENTGAGTFADRYQVADNQMPQWAADSINTMYDAAHEIGIRNRETGSTFTYDYPDGKFDLAIALEGANNTSELRARGIAEAVRAGSLVVPHLAVVSTGRDVGPKEGHPEYVKTGYQVGNIVTNLLRTEYPDVFCEGGVKLESMHIRTHKAQTQETVAEAALRVGAVRERPIESVVMSGSNIYGSWMQTDLAAAKHVLGMDRVGFGAPADSAKAARTDIIWTSEVAKALESAARLQHVYNTKKR